MDDTLNAAMQMLIDGNYTCVIMKDQAVHTSTQRGVAPLISHLDQGTRLRGFSAADKVVGKATAFLYCLLGVRAVYAQVMSTNAAQVLAAHGISAFCTRLVTGIRNRTDTGPCPMEAATRDLTDPEEALAAIRRTLHNLQQA